MIKNLYFKVVFQILAILFLIGCRQELENYNQHHSHNSVDQSLYRIRILKGKEAESISNILNSQFEKTQYTKFFSKGESGEIDYSEITEVIDSAGIVNYTFKINNHPEDSYKTFHNLVLTENDSELEIHILKYEMSENLAQEVLSNGEMEYFEGTVQSSSAGPDTDPGGGNNDCPPVSTGGGGGGGTDTGNPGDTGDPGNNNGGGGGGTCTIVEVSYTCLDCGASYSSWGDLSGSVCGNGNYPIAITITYKTTNLGCKQVACNVGGNVAVAYSPNPCEILKSQNTNEAYKKRMDTLKSKTNLTKENGYMQYKNGGFTKATVSANNDTTDALEINTSISMIGYMHTHLDPYELEKDGRIEKRSPIKMFSPADVKAFLQIVKYNSDENRLLLNTYGTLVSSSGNYTLKFTGNKDQIKTTFLSNETYNNMFLKFFEDNEEKGLEVNFLNFISEKMNIRGVSLYKINNDGTISRKELSADKKSVISTDCPQ